MEPNRDSGGEHPTEARVNVARAASAAVGIIGWAERSRGAKSAAQDIHVRETRDTRLETRQRHPPMQKQSSNLACSFSRQTPQRPAHCTNSRVSGVGLASRGWSATATAVESNPRKPV
ncbi:MAG: hypothetical protein J6X55_09050 [Victivallales bacterium]|nr:hypothetical protein [Victivallales bacterium]